MRSKVRFPIPECKFYTKYNNEAGIYVFSTSITINRSMTLKCNGITNVCQDSEIYLDCHNSCLSRLAKLPVEI